jgi:hypothetical protein
LKKPRKNRGSPSGFERIPTPQNQFDDLPIDSQPALTRKIQEEFQEMSQMKDGLQIEKTCAALEGMKGAEDRIRGFRICRLLFEHKHSLFYASEMFPGLDHKLMQKIDISGRRRN